MWLRLAVLVVLAATPAAAATLPTVTATALLASFGANTHLGWWDAAGWAATAWPTIEADVRAAGIRVLRDGPPASGWPYTLPEYQRLCAQGVRFDLVVGSQWAAVLPDIDRLAVSAPGCVLAIEGPNEANGVADVYAGHSAAADFPGYAHALMGDLYRAVHADPALAGVRVWNLTLLNPTPALVASLGDMSAVVDAGTGHPYAGRAAPAGALATGLGYARTIAPGRPVVATEFGYSSEAPTGAVPAWSTVTPAQQAAWTLDTWLDLAAAGATGLVYELADNGARVTGDNEGAFGLFSATGAPYPVATAMRALTTLLADAGTGTGAPVGATVLGAVSALGVSRSDGYDDVLVWGEGDGQAVTVTFGSPRASIAIYDPLIGTTPISSASNAAVVHLTVTDHPLLVRAAKVATACGVHPLLSEWTVWIGTGAPYGTRPATIKECPAGGTHATQTTYFQTVQCVAGAPVAVGAPRRVPIDLWQRGGAKCG